MDDYELWLRKEGKRLNTIVRYLQIASDFQEWHKACAGCAMFHPQNVSGLDLQKWKTYLLNEATYQRAKEGPKRKYSITSVNNSIKGIKVYFDFLTETGAIPANPAGDLKLEKIQDEGEPRWLEHSVRGRLLSYIENTELRKKNVWRFNRNRAIVFAIMYAGLRVSEVVDLELADVDFQNEVLQIRNGKTGKERSVSMNKELIDALQEWIRERGRLLHTKKLFVSQRGGALTTDGLKHIFKQLRDKTGIPGFTPHVLRHTFARDLAERGESLRKITELLGNSNVDYARHYLVERRSMFCETS